MSKRRVTLLIIVTAILAGYCGFYYARHSDLVRNSQVVIQGVADSIEPGYGPAAFPTPKSTMAKCKIGNFVIETYTENVEYAFVKIGDLSPAQFGCLLEEAQQSFQGDPPPSPLAPEDPNELKSYRPMYMSFKPVTNNAQKN